MNKSLLLALAVCISLSTFALTPKKQSPKCTLTVASYNLRLNTPSDGENAWPLRKDKVNALIRFYDFDIFGTQEGFASMLGDITAAGDYAYIGAGRDDGKSAGEHSAIIYKKDRFELLDQGNFWLSETPEKPGLGWDATCCNRICSWGKFKDKISGKTFYFFNVHYDHQGVIARRESSKLILQRIKKIAGKGSTVILTGDFNAVPTDEPITTLAADGLLLDSRTITKQPPYGTVGTFNNFNVNVPPSERIDYIWVTKNVHVLKYGVINDIIDGHYPSDHCPAMAKIQF